MQPEPPPPPIAEGVPPRPVPSSVLEAERAAHPTFYVRVADVGTGLAVFVEGDDFALVYDAGSNDDTAVGDKNRFVAYLKAIKSDLSRIDHVVLSHPHRDHVELLADVVSRYEIGDVWDPGAINPICGYRRFVQAVADASNVKYHTAVNAAGTHKLDFGKELCDKPKLPRTVSIAHAARITENVPVKLGNRASMTFLHVDGRPHGDRFHENTLVTVLELDGTRVLLMGDAEAGGREAPASAPKKESVEGYVLEKYKAQLRADVLVAGNHGSTSSSRKAFIDAVAPKVSVISSGPTKYAGVQLPDPAIVQELQQAGELFRTDLDDAACAKKEDKIGPTADNQPGGCNNVRIEIKDQKVTAEYEKIPE
jgi:competence protein ComEC